MGQVLIFILGALIVVWALVSAVRTVVVPRAESVLLTRLVALSIARGLQLLTPKRKRSFGRTDRVMSFLAPSLLLALAAVWFALVFIGFSLMFWALGNESLRESSTLSGSSLTTLGFAAPDSEFERELSFFEAGLGLGLVALVISYLPSIYSAFQRREQSVTLLSMYGGDPPTGTEIILRYQHAGGLPRLTRLFQRWEELFADMEESHTSFSGLCFFRSPVPQRSWIVASGAVLDAAALTSSCLSVERDPDAELCCQSGHVALRKIAQALHLPVADEPDVEKPISVTRQEFDDAVNSMRQAGVALRTDEEQMWNEFVEWRSRYDHSLIAICGMVYAPPAPWSSDRSVHVKQKWLPESFRRRSRNK